MSPNGQHSGKVSRIIIQNKIWPSQTVSVLLLRPWLFGKILIRKNFNQGKKMRGIILVSTKTSEKNRSSTQTWSLFPNFPLYILSGSFCNWILRWRYLGTQKQPVMCRKFIVFTKIVFQNYLIAGLAESVKPSSLLVGRETTVTLSCQQTVSFKKQQYSNWL